MYQEEKWKMGTHTISVGPGLGNVSNAVLCGQTKKLGQVRGVVLPDLFPAFRVSTHLDFSHWKNVSRRLGTMKAHPSWFKVNEGFYAPLVTPYKDGKFEGL